MTDIELYDLLLTTVHVISKTNYARVFALKGGTVLISRVIDNNRQDLFRRTSDIDIHCTSYVYWEHFCNEIELILNKAGTGYRYKIVKRRGDTKPSTISDSLHFDVIRLYDNQTARIKIDMNVKSNEMVELDFSNSLGMYTFSVQTSIADKVKVVSSPQIFRRIKDVYDLAVYATLYSVSYCDLLRAIEKKYPSIELVNMFIPQNMNDLQHAYDKFDGIINKPAFGDLYTICARFLYPIYKKSSCNLKWNRGTMAWEKQS